MLLKAFTFTLFVGLCALASPLTQADSLSLGKVQTAAVTKADISQPYIVKKGDTLWDIADHFFQNPQRWIKVWERNLYITNPDLIYPGNTIWFDGKRLQQGGLTTVKPTPKVLIKPVERLEVPDDHSIMLTALARQDFINPEDINGVGHILDSLDDRLNFGANDRVYVQLNKTAKVGDLFDVFRNSDVVHNLHSANIAGVLVQHLGQIRITSASGATYRGLVVKAFEEMSRGDRLKPARSIDPHITPIASTRSLSGSIMYIRNNAHEAAQNQVIGISLGQNDGLKTGTVMAVLRSGRIVADKLAHKNVLLPTEKIGELIVLVPQKQASIALITSSTASIHIGDRVVTTAVP